jgi:hypothetical protein
MDAGARVTNRFHFLGSSATDASRTPSVACSDALHRGRTPIGLTVIEPIMDSLQPMR